MEHLELLGAVERKESQVLLTALGKKMASFPLEPRYAKVKKIQTNLEHILNVVFLCFSSLFCLNLVFCTDVAHTHNLARE